MNKYQMAVYIGRFQPLHIGHLHVIEEALKISDRLTIVVGSHEKSPDIRNPLSSADRHEIFRAAGILDNVRIHVVYQHDHPYNEIKWIEGVQQSVFAATNSYFIPGPTKTCIIGYDKDHTSFYLKKFPQWEIIDIEPKYDIDATTIRNIFWKGEGVAIKWFPTRGHRQTFIDKMDAVQLQNEFVVIQNYKKQWESSPYPVSFVTGDAVVTQSGHILLVRRSASPGMGQLALPGGFLDINERISDTIIRELKEETKIDIPLPALKGSIIKTAVYDDPLRSTRGRTITHAAHFSLYETGNGLTKVKASSDAADCLWMTISEFVTRRSEMFEDHFSIVEDMLGL